MAVRASKVSRRTQYVAVVGVGLVSGGIGKLLLDWFALLNRSQAGDKPPLTWAIGPAPVWMLTSAVVWLMLSSRLRRSTPHQCAAIGLVAYAIGLALLYIPFTYTMGLPGGFEELLGAVLFFPFFAVTATVVGGLVAIPAALCLAFIVRWFLRSADSPIESAVEAQQAG